MSKITNDNPVGTGCFTITLQSLYNMATMDVKRLKELLIQREINRHTIFYI